MRRGSDRLFWSDACCCPICGGKENAVGKEEIPKDKQRVVASIDDSLEEFCYQEEQKKKADSWRGWGDLHMISSKNESQSCRRRAGGAELSRHCPDHHLRVSRLQAQVTPWVEKTESSEWGGGSGFRARYQRCTGICRAVSWVFGWKLTWWSEPVYGEASETWGESRWQEVGEAFLGGHARLGVCCVLTGVERPPNTEGIRSELSEGLLPW